MSDYNFVELVTNGAKNRGKVIELPGGTSPDYFGKPAPVDAYCSVYRFGPDFGDFVKASATVRGFTGPCLATSVHFDLDGETALADLRNFVMRTCKREELSVFIDDFKFWFSGNKGVHATIENESTRAIPARKDTPDLIKKYAFKLAGDLKSFDRSIYDKTRIFRIPNTKHSKSGLHKIPLLAGEVFSLEMQDIRDLAKTQRNIQTACQHWLAGVKEMA
jgi:hypothetical protein